MEGGCSENGFMFITIFSAAKLDRSFLSDSLSCLVVSEKLVIEAGSYFMDEDISI